MFLRILSWLGFWPLIVAAQVAFLYHAPWWDLPYREMGWAAGISAVFLGICFARLRSLHVVWAKILETVLWTWSAGVVLSAPWAGSLDYLIFALFSVAYVGIGVAWLKRESGRSWVNSFTPWYQGSPRIIPEVRVRFDGQGFQVSHLDREGFFMVLPPGAEHQLPSRSKSGEFAFEFQSSRSSVIGTVKRDVGQQRSVGVKLEPMHPDSLKRWGDFVEKIRSTGYEMV